MFENWTPEQKRIVYIFERRHVETRIKAVEAGQRFVHYSSAEAAFRMIEGRKVWMRQATTMNDFKEIAYGNECLVKAWRSERDGARLQATLDRMFPGIFAQLSEIFDTWLPHIHADTYMTCISEHDAEEDLIGRLSMWRAYGGNSGVAIVLNGAPFFLNSNALKAYSYPVFYASPERFDQEFTSVVDAIEENFDFLRGLGEEHVKVLLRDWFRSVVTCTKHPGFREEREWRIIYSPSWEKSERIKPSLECVRGVPQHVQKIPLEDVPDEGLIGITVKDLVDRVIIGPSQYPIAIYQAFVALLHDRGVDEPENKVVLSTIPLRQPS